MADQIRATPRNPFFGLFSDVVNAPLSYMSDPRRTQQMQGVASFLRSTGVPYTLENLSYDPSGRGLFTGAGGLGGTTRLRPEAAEAALTVAPFVGPAAKVGVRGAMATGRTLGPTAAGMAERYMQRQGLMPSLDVYHGSPYKFDKFDSSKIGTGEGAQAYGYGLYLAESPSVAKQYKETLAQKAFAKIEQVDRNNYRVTAPDGSVISEGLPLGPSTRAKDAFNANAGSIYQVDLPDEQIAKMLDYDKPLSKQAPEIKAKLKAVVDDQMGAGMWDQWIKSEPEFKNLDNDLFEDKTPEEISALLREAGIPGIRYLDQSSRATPNITNKRLADLYEKYQGNAEAAVNEMMRSVYNTPKKKAEMREQFMKQLQTPKTSNFVVFPGAEDTLRIMRRNEEAVNPMFADPFANTIDDTTR